MKREPHRKGVKATSTHVEIGHRLWIFESWHTFNDK